MSRQAIEWQPSKLLAGLMQVVVLVLTILALAGFAALYGESSFVLTGSDVLKLIALVPVIAILVVVHELLHGLGFRLFGHRPSYGATMIGGILPAFYCTAKGAQLRKSQFAFVGLLPGLVLCIAPALYIVAHLPYAGWLVVPAAVITGGAAGDVFMVARGLAAPKGTLIEDRMEGIIMHVPTEARPTLR